MSEASDMSDWEDSAEGYERWSGPTKEPRHVTRKLGRPKRNPPKQGYRRRASK